MLVKNISARIHHLSDAAGNPLALLPGESVELPSGMHAKIMASPSAKAGELVPWNQPMPAPKGMSLGALDEEKAGSAIQTCQDIEILKMWLKSESRVDVKGKIAARITSLLPPPPPPPAPDATEWSAPAPKKGK